MKKLFFILLFSIILFLAKAFVSDTTGLYNPSADATADIEKAVKLADKEHKFVLIQAGGNWCVWCLRFNKFVTEDLQIDSLVHAGFIVYHLNYSKENTNKAVFAKYGFPQRFGFPVFIILDEKGNRIHTQNSAYLEEGKSYNKEKVFEFLKDWTPNALNPDKYKDK